ncbi:MULTISPECIES: DUF3093 domain-containing protein [unclassified Streptomyces]|uniref:DUF3093 domain-containing protein n=1 Tax=unclassified Streptomyces TaxID=2593676 RepID=UPI002DDA5743|nr:MULTISPECIES: DUF3093 domain-containing protein [unclassified Streptomyces]WSA91931.1 DUF3093 domain-containing protein [Streptomyces sp. NBC_01795]WSB76299.1 DUF3093 domain-containing protein [Streptomyces sp. NBC_01775]WSS15426.1 DUF3093 domain-containing protein [Streptomyces sp. NBC_01186]WSS44269.1 DUF3093 domain-containing protein [Streptomyces sp. NBC_01187]
MVPPAQSYDERLTAPRSWWLIAAGIGVGCALMLLPFGLLPMLCALVAGAALACVCVSTYGSVRVRVVADSLVAGDARIPLSALGEVAELDAEEARAWRTYKADARAHMMLRSYITTAVRIEVTDPQDPTPYVYLSTRHPERLAAAVRSAHEEPAA